MIVKQLLYYNDYTYDIPLVLITDTALLTKKAKITLEDKKIIILDRIEVENLLSGIDVLKKFI